MNRLTNKTHPLITEHVVECLNRHNIYNEQDFLRTKVIVLQNITKLKFKDICKLFVQFSSQVPVYNGADVLKNIKENELSISSGIESVDLLLEGGFINYKLYELYGLPGSGKSLFCYNVMRQYLMQHHNYVYYIDTKRSFDAIKFREMLQSKLLTDDIVDQCLKRLLVIQCGTKYEVLNALYSIKNNINQNLYKTQLIIMDSLPAVSYTAVSYQRDIELLDHIWNTLNMLSNWNYVACIVTNIISKTIETSGTAEKIEEKSQSKYYETIKLQIDHDKCFKLTILSYDKLGYETLYCHFEL